MTTRVRIEPLPGALEERFRSPSVGLTDPRPVSALSYEEWRGVLLALCRDVYGMGDGHPLMAGVTAEDWRRWYDDPDRATTRMQEALSVVAACALCNVRLPLIAARGDVWVQWMADTQRQRGQFPAWAAVENRRLIVVNLFGDAGIPAVTEPERSEAVDRALKREHVPMSFERPELLMPEGVLPLERVVLPGRLHNDDLPATIPAVPDVVGYTNLPPFPIDYSTFVLPPELAGQPGYKFPEVNPQLVPADPDAIMPADWTRPTPEAAIRPIVGQLVTSESAVPSPALDWIAETLASRTPPAPAAVVGERHNATDAPVVLGTHQEHVIVDDPHQPKDAKAAHLAKVKAWYAEMQAKRSKGGR